MPKFIVCPECEGTGSSSAYLGAFTSDEMDEMGDDFRDDYAAGRFDRNCDHCKGLRVVRSCKIDKCTNEAAIINGYFGRHESDKCFDHDADMRESAECESQHRAEIAYGC